MPHVWQLNPSLCQWLKYTLRHHLLLEPMNMNSSFKGFSTITKWQMNTQGSFQCQLIQSSPAVISYKAASWPGWVLLCPWHWNYSLSPTIRIFLCPTIPISSFYSDSNKHKQCCSGLYRHYPNFYPQSCLPTLLLQGRINPGIIALKGWWFNSTSWAIGRATLQILLKQSSQ